MIFYDDNNNNSDTTTTITIGWSKYNIVTVTEMRN